MIRFSKWSVLAAALAALVAFLDSLTKLFSTFTHLPLSDWAVVLSQYKLEFVAAIIFAGVALTLDWRAVGGRYAVYRQFWAGRKVPLGFATVYPEEVVWLFFFFLLGASFVVFEVQKARNLYVSYGFGYIIEARCEGNFLAARDRSDALARNYFWSKYSDILRNLKDRYDYLNAIAPRRIAVFGRYKNELPPDILQSDSYELRVLFAANPDIGARAHEPKDFLTKSWLESSAPCKGS